jgi:two-component system cell cycle sensor histidine kinase/response regulator CckA
VQLDVHTKPVSPPVGGAHEPKRMHVLLVEDNHIDARFVTGLLKSSLEAFPSHHASGLAEALLLLKTMHFDVVLLDLNLGDSTGHETFAAVHQAAPKRAILVLSGSDDEELAVRTVREGAQDYLVKGSFDKRLLLRSIRYAYERKQTEEALRKSEATVRAIFESSLDGIVILNNADVCLEANSAAATLFGMPRNELSGNNIQKFTEADFGPEWGRLRSMGAGRGRFWVRREGGTRRLVDCSYSADILPGQHLCVLRDITEQHTMEEHLRQSQKMEAVGRLAGGIAHDFNNILGIISGYAELMQLNSNDEALISRTSKILAATQKASALSKKLLAFGRKQFVSPQLLDLVSVMNEVDNMVRCMVGAEIQYVIQFEKGLGRVKADQGQLEQVILNLAANARDAMPTHGTLTIRLENCKSSGASPELPAGDYVMLSVNDTGAGMDAETQSRMFEPFFSTKKTGAGLGLATVYGIVKQSGGTITVQSALNEGSTFNVYLPVVGGNDAQPAKLASASAIPKAHGTVLLVDDDDVLREAMGEYLTDCGYTVLRARDGSEAIGLSDSHSGTIDIVISDLIMPRVNGAGLLGYLGKTRPETGILIISGHADDTAVHHGIHLETTSFLQKPFTFQTLREKISGLMARPLPTN